MLSTRETLTLHIFYVGFACSERAVKTQWKQQCLLLDWSFLCKEGSEWALIRWGISLRRTQRILETYRISKILWFWFTTCSCVLASSVCSRELQKDILMYDHDPYLLWSPCFLPHSPRQRPGSNKIIVFCPNAKCWAFSVGCSAFPAVSTKVPVIWFPSRRSLVPKLSHGFPAPTRHTFPFLGTVLGRTWQVDLSSNYCLCVYLGSGLRWVHSCS